MLPNWKAANTRELLQVVNVLDVLVRCGHAVLATCYDTEETLKNFDVKTLPQVTHERGAESEVSVRVKELQEQSVAKLREATATISQLKNLSRCMVNVIRKSFDAVNMVMQEVPKLRETRKAGGNKLLTSLSSITKATISCTNGTAMAVNVNWIGFEGNESRYARLEPGEAWNCETYATHVWHMRSVDDGSSESHKSLRP